MSQRSPIIKNVIASVTSSTASTGITGPIVLRDTDFNSLGFKVVVPLLGGSSPTLDLWLQSSDDGGVTFYDVMRFPRISATAGNATPFWGFAATLDATRLPSSAIGACTISSTAGGIGVSLLSNVLQLQWALGGTTPTASFTVTAEELEVSRGIN